MRYKNPTPSPQAMRGLRYILKTARSWTFLSYKKQGSKPLPVAGRGLPEGFHIWLNYEPFAV
jgi:hypothetical protein